MKRNLLLLSNSTNYGEPYFQYAKSYLKKFLENTSKDVLFIPYAAVSFTFDEYEKKVQDALKDAGIKITSIHHHTDPERAVQEAEILAVGGGNTFHLLKLLYHYNLPELIHRRIKEGMPYIGWSAGSNVVCPSIKTTNDMPVTEPPSFKAINAIPFQINPHFTDATIPGHGGESREERLREFIEANPGQYVVGLPEGNILHISDDTVELIGGKKIKVMRKGEEIKELSSDNNLDFLLY